MFRMSNPSLFYLCLTFNKSKDEIRDALQNHPHSNVPLPFTVIHENIEYLLREGFTRDDIFQDLQIILYSL